ncbi:TPM domain-containing protein [Acinetobacter larvae]|uniref:TPM domain-containing protein n=1 Tax=Acinetobacter larvae TaxID=1789224 RepID=A0A1B2LVW6_9GAMM|nr:TPM domain-containing protein [Acinetobacter larvae]AOA57077.1 hypothetical protein BFG52_01070 [Acinetobacter larvae]
MVTTTDTTQIVTTAKLQLQAAPSFKRWFKHLCYLPMTKRWFKKADQQVIASAVDLAEQGHAGEIQVVIEGHIPCALAYRHNTRQRAEQLFAELGVWDTEYNSGVLLYLNLCEQRIEIVIDRGIHSKTLQENWQQICQHMGQQLQQKQYCQAVVDGVMQIGAHLSAYYAHYPQQDIGNELANAPILLD